MVLGQLCDRFEAAWKAGQRPLIEAYWADIQETGRLAALRELLPVELAYRIQAGEKPTLQEYQLRFPRHAESVEVAYDPARISYEQLLDVYWHHIDPLTLNSAFCDYGPQYRSIIFYHDAEQQRAAEASKRALDASHRFATPIVTTIQPATPFYPAEEYHQQFYKKNPARYEAYRIGCGRDQRIRELWGDLAVSKGAGQ